jgi:hypothetical protein
MADQISVNVGLSAKVSNPQNQFENSTFSRSITRTITIASPPEDPDKVVDYEVWVKRLISGVEQDLKKTIDDQVQREIDEFYEENSGEES